MQDVLELPISRSPSVVEGYAPEILDRIGDPSVELAIWRREQPAAISQWLDALTSRGLPQGRILLHLDDLDAGIEALVSGKTKPARDLAADMANLSCHFAILAGSKLVDIRLDAISHDACRRFHRDMVPLRLLVSYRGPGTQIPPLEHAPRALAEQRAYHGPLMELPRGTVVLFKGDPCASGRGVLHRSPPVADAGLVRLLLCLNIPTSASPPRWHRRLGQYSGAGG